MLPEFDSEEARENEYVIALGRVFDEDFAAAENPLDALYERVRHEANDGDLSDAVFGAAALLQVYPFDRRFMSLLQRLASAAGEDLVAVTAMQVVNNPESQPAYLNLGEALIAARLPSLEFAAHVDDHWETDDSGWLLATALAADSNYIGALTVAEQTEGIADDPKKGSDVAWWHLLNDDFEAAEKAVTVLGKKFPTERTTECVAQGLERYCSLRKGFATPREWVYVQTGTAVACTLGSSAAEAGDYVFTDEELTWGDAFEAASSAVMMLGLHDRAITGVRATGNPTANIMARAIAELLGVDYATPGEGQSENELLVGLDPLDTYTSQIDRMFLSSANLSADEDSGWDLTLAVCLFGNLAGVDTPPSAAIFLGRPVLPWDVDGDFDPAAGPISDWLPTEIRAAKRLIQGADDDATDVIEDPVDVLEWYEERTEHTLLGAGEDVVCPPSGPSWFTLMPGV